jgi:hypothetical protein
MPNKTINEENLHINQYTFVVKPISQTGFSLITWEVPRRSLQVETKIANLWAKSPAMLVLLEKVIEDSKYGDVSSETINRIYDIIEELGFLVDNCYFDNIIKKATLI